MCVCVSRFVHSAVHQIQNESHASMEECPVCLEPLRKETLLQPCRHALCAACTESVVDASGGRCPICRRVIAGITTTPTSHGEDKQYEEEGETTPADLEGNAEKGEGGTRKETSVLIDVRRERHAGITLRNHAHGVQVTRLHPGDAASEKLHVGDVITHINGLAAVHHRSAVGVIDAATQHDLPILCCVRTRRRGRRLAFRLRLPSLLSACLPSPPLPTSGSSTASSLAARRARLTEYYASHDQWTAGHTQV